MVMVLLPFVLAYLPVHLPELITRFATQSPWLSPVCNKPGRLALFLPSTVLFWNSLPPLVISTSSSSHPPLLPSSPPLLSSPFLPIFPIFPFSPLHQNGFPQAALQWSRSLGLKFVRCLVPGWA